MKRKYWGLLLLFLLILAGCSSLSQSKKSKEVTENQIKKEEQKIEEKEDHRLVTGYPGMEIFYNSYENEQMQLSYFEPVTDSPEIDETIHTWLEAENEEFIEEVKYLNPSKDKDSRSNHHIELDTKILNEDERIYSLVFEESSILSGSNNFKKYKAYNFDLVENKLYKINDFFDISSEKLKELVYEELAKKEDVAESLNEESFHKAIENIEEVDFRIMKGDLYIYFDSSEILPHSFGGQIVFIPFHKTMDLCKDEVFKILSQDQIEKVEMARNSETELSKTENTETELPKAENAVALTFDDGPHPQTTPQLLDILDQYDAKVTFFILGENANNYPHIVKDMVDRGHEVASHSYSHPNFRNLSHDGLIKELTLSRDAIKNAGGVAPVLIRPPYGWTNETIKSTIESLGLKQTMWSVDTEDWKSKNPQAILQEVKTHTSAGDIVLMHDIHQTTIDSMPAVIEYLQNQGFKLTTVSQLP